MLLSEITNEIMAGLRVIAVAKFVCRMQLMPEAYFLICKLETVPLLPHSDSPLF